MVSVFCVCVGRLSLSCTVICDVNFQYQYKQLNESTGKGLKKEKVARGWGRRLFSKCPSKRGRRVCDYLRGAINQGTAIINMVFSNMAFVWRAIWSEKAMSSKDFQNLLKRSNIFQWPQSHSRTCKTISKIQDLFKVVWTICRVYIWPIGLGNNYIPSHNCWNAGKFFLLFLFNVDFKDIYAQTNTWNQHCGKGREAIREEKETKVMLCFPEVFQQIMTRIVCPGLSTWVCYRSVWF